MWLVLNVFGNFVVDDNVCIGYEFISWWGNKGDCVCDFFFCIKLVYGYLRYGVVVYIGYIVFDEVLCIVIDKNRFWWNCIYVDIFWS